MFNKKFVNFLLNYLGVIFMFLFFIAVIVGFIQANDYPAETAGKVGYFIGFVGSSSVFFAFFYSIVAILYKLNNLEFNKNIKEEKVD